MKKNLTGQNRELISSFKWCIYPQVMTYLRSSYGKVQYFPGNQSSSLSLQHTQLVHTFLFTANIHHSEKYL